MERSLELLSKVKAGLISGKMLAASERQGLVSLLAADGLSGPEIAQILQVSDRTVERDRREIRERYALPRDPTLADQMAGRILAEAELSMQRIRRAARDREVDAAIKIDAEHRCFQIANAMVDRLQKLGYLPTAAMRLHANLTHTMQDLPTSDELLAQVETLRALAQEHSGTGQGASSPQVLEALGVISSTLARAEAATQIKQVVNTASVIPSARRPNEPAQ